ncbi:MAG: hypothetical protein ACLP1D_20335, partial [Xanthobacteraceae bacterium]
MICSSVNRFRFIAWSFSKGPDSSSTWIKRQGQRQPLSPELIKRVAHMTLHEKPPNATHWSGRSMAAAAG